MVEIGLAYYGTTTIGGSTYYKIRAVYFPTDGPSNLLINLLSKLKLTGGFDFGEFINVEREAPRTIAQGTEMYDYTTNDVYTIPETVRLTAIWDAPIMPTLGPYTVENLWGKSPILYYAASIWQDLPAGERPFEAIEVALPPGTHTHIPLNGWALRREGIASTWKGSPPSSASYAPRWIGVYNGMHDAPDTPRRHIADPEFQSDDSLNWQISFSEDSQYISYLGEPLVTTGANQNTESADCRFLWVEDYDTYDLYAGNYGPWSVEFEIGTASEGAYIWVYRQVLSPVVFFPHKDTPFSFPVIRPRKPIINSILEQGGGYNIFTSAPVLKGEKVL